MKLSKPELSSLELHATVKELQVLAGSKVDQIYESDNGEFFFQFHVPQLGKRLLRVVPGKFAYLTEHKIEMATPHPFCMQLRKHLSGGIMNSIAQVESQRILMLEIQKEKNYRMFIELFSKGNIVLCEEPGKIIAVWQRQSWQSREIRPELEYKLPPLDVELFTLSESGFTKMLGESKKDKIVTCLATELGLGGLYAEETCVRASVEKDSQPGSIDKRGKQVLWESFRHILTELEKPRGFVYDNIIAPIQISGYELKKEYPSFTEALDARLSMSKAEQEHTALEAKYAQRIAELQRILEHQEQALVQVDAGAAEESAQGDFIYEHYSEIKKFFESVKKVQVEKGWVAVEQMLKGMKNIRLVDMKEKRIVVEMR